MNILFSLRKKQRNSLFRFHIIVLMAIFYLLFGHGIGVCKMEIPVELAFNYSENLVLNAPWKLSFLYTPRIDTKESKANIIIPNDLELLNGVLKWTGDLPSGKTLILEIELLFSKIGEYKIISEFTFQDSWGNKFTKPIACYIIIDKETVDISGTHFSNMKRKKFKEKLKTKSNYEKDLIEKSTINFNKIESKEIN